MTRKDFETTTSPPSANEKLVFEGHPLQWDDVLGDLGDNRDKKYSAEAIIPNTLDERHVDNVFLQQVYSRSQSHTGKSDNRVIFLVPVSNPSRLPPRSCDRLPNKSEFSLYFFPKITISMFPPRVVYIIVIDCKM
jgi:hypothetical protein